MPRLRALWRNWLVLSGFWPGAKPMVGDGAGGLGLTQLEILRPL